MTEQFQVSSTPSGVRVQLRVIPRASRTGVDGVRDGRLLLRVTAPPVDRAANDAVILTLARLLDLPRRAISIVSGSTGRNKTIEIAGLDAATVRARLSP